MAIPEMTLARLTLFRFTAWVVAATRTDRVLATFFNILLIRDM